ncbi:NAD(P)-binding domain-containing protein [Kibdelosporangium philippinense]|uniref:NAD(P)-binding domain-containing protein n=1 Tax=Kibdelosporangium philippinense TaxID=211113 RepID=A0ABS8Z575_9PSEU|nr:NAD(P)-binding domain-containing protein [Kibdelosporangium philippinense]MCE7003061.1 NAD(P)-binding domain-containing protein [Kibdelosporangium philippinense]
MRIAIIGTGNVGGGLAAAATKNGHEVTVVAAHHEHAVKLAEHTGAKAAATTAEAAVGAEAVVLAVPASAAAEVLSQLGEDAIVIDATNPLNETYSDLTTTGTSHAEALAAAAPNVKLVKAFNTVFASRLNNSNEDGQPLDGYYAGDDEAAKAKTAELLQSLGFRPIDAGSLRMARALEELAFLNITLNARNEWSWQSAWRLAGPTA